MEYQHKDLPLMREKLYGLNISSLNIRGALNNKINFFHGNKLGGIKCLQ